MTIGGWIIMVLAIGGMSSLLGWCIWRVLTTPGTAEHVHSPTDSGTPDV